jgi:hypothetical protein
MLENTMKLHTVFARKEPTTDEVAKTFGLRKKDTVYYHDRACRQMFARKPWYHSGHPTKSTKKVQLNCWPWALQWVPAVDEVKP